MAEASSEANTPSSNAAEQARIRKERREAKIRAGGSARLNKITGLGGGVQRGTDALYLSPHRSRRRNDRTDFENLEPQPQAAATEHADPAEVDISQHYYEPPRSTRSSNLPKNATPTPSPQEQMNDNALRQMMLGFDPSGTPPPGQNPFAGFPGMGGGTPGLGMPGMEGMGAGADDPMMKMLQQMMMGGMPGEGAGGAPAFPGMPGQTPTPAADAAADPSAYLWRVVHAVFALGLGLYIAFTTSFTGSRLERESPYTRENGQLSAASVHFFWIFATAEVLLQTSRYFMEKGRIQPGGIMGMVMGFLPEPWKGYLGLVGRYSRIWMTVSADAMTCVFVLGACAWLRGA